MATLYDDGHFKNDLAYKDRANWVREELKHIRMIHFLLVSLCFAVIYLFVISRDDIDGLKALKSELKTVPDYVFDAKPSQKLFKSLRAAAFKTAVLPMLEAEINNALAGLNRGAIQVDPTRLNRTGYSLVIVSDSPSLITYETISEFYNLATDGWVVSYAQPKLVTDALELSIWLELNRSHLSDSDDFTGILYIAGSRVYDEAGSSFLELTLSNEFISPNSFVPFEDLKLIYVLQWKVMELSAGKVWIKEELPQIDKFLGQIQGLKLNDAENWSEDQFKQNTIKTSAGFLGVTLNGYYIGQYFPLIFLVIFALYYWTFFQN